MEISQPVLPNGESIDSHHKPIIDSLMRAILKTRDCRQSSKDSTSSFVELSDVLRTSADLISGYHKAPDLPFWLGILDSLFNASDDNNAVSPLLSVRNYRVDKFIPRSFEVVEAGTDAVNGIYTFKKIDKEGKPVYEFFNSANFKTYTLLRYLVVPGIDDLERRVWRWYLSIPDLHKPGASNDQDFYDSYEEDFDLPPCNAEWISSVNNTRLLGAKPYPTLKNSREVVNIHADWYRVTDTTHRSFVIASLQFFSKLVTICDKKRYLIDSTDHQFPETETFCSTLFGFMKQVRDFELSKMSCNCLYNWCMPYRLSAATAQLDSNDELLELPAKCILGIWDIFLGLGFCSFEYSIDNFTRGEIPIGYIEHNATLALQIPNSSDPSGASKNIVLDIKDNILSSLESYYLHPQFNVNDITVVSYALLALHTLLTGDNSSKLDLIMFRIKCLYLILHSTCSSDVKHKAFLKKLLSSDSIILKELVALCDISSEISRNVRNTFDNFGKKISELSLQCVLFMLSQLLIDFRDQRHGNRSGGQYIDSGLLLELGFRQDPSNRSSEQVDSPWITILSSVLVSSTSLAFGEKVVTLENYLQTQSSGYIQLGLELLLNSFGCIDLNDYHHPSNSLAGTSLLPPLIGVINSFYPILETAVTRHTATKVLFDHKDQVQNLERQIIYIVTKSCFCLKKMLAYFSHRDRPEGSSSSMTLMQESKMINSLVQLLELCSEKVEALLSPECAISHAILSLLEMIISLYSKFLRHNSRLMVNPSESGILHLKTPMFAHLLKYLFHKFRQGHEDLWFECICILKDMIHLELPYINVMIESEYFPNMMKNFRYSPLLTSIDIFSEFPNVQSDIVIKALCQFVVNCCVKEEGQKAMKTHGVIEFIIESVTHKSLILPHCRFSVAKSFFDDVGQAMCHLSSIKSELKELIVTNFVNKIVKLCTELDLIWWSLYKDGIECHLETKWNSEYMQVLQKITNICSVFEAYLTNVGNGGVQVAENLPDALLSKLIRAMWCTSPDPKQLFTQLGIRYPSSEINENNMFCGYFPAIKSISKLVHRLIEPKHYGSNGGYIKKVVTILNENIASRLDMISKYASYVLNDDSLVTKIEVSNCGSPECNGIYTLVEDENKTTRGIPTYSFSNPDTNQTFLITRCAVLEPQRHTQSNRWYILIPNPATGKPGSNMDKDYYDCVLNGADNKPMPPLNNEWQASTLRDQGKLCGTSPEPILRDVTMKSISEEVATNSGTSKEVDIIGILDKIPDTCVFDNCELYDKKEKNIALFLVSVMNLEWLLSEFALVLKAISKSSHIQDTSLGSNFDFPLIERAYTYFRSALVGITRFASIKFKNDSMSTYNNMAISECFSRFDSTEDSTLKERIPGSYVIRVNTNKMRIREHLSNENSREVLALDRGCTLIAYERGRASNGEICYRTKYGWLCGARSRRDRDPEKDIIEVLSVKSKKNSDILLVQQQTRINEMLTLKESVCLTLSMAFKETFQDIGKYLSRDFVYNYKKVPHHYRRSPNPNERPSWTGKGTHIQYKYIYI